MYLVNNTNGAKEVSQTNMWLLFKVKWAMSQPYGGEQVNFK